MKNVIILGSTGSIGVNTLNVIREFPDKFKVKGLTVNKNIGLLEQQIDEFSPDTVVVTDELKAQELERIIGNKCSILKGEKGLLQLAGYDDYDILVSALVGFAGLAPTIEGIKKKKRIALANKETLVVAGEIITKLISSCGAEMIPVDSEHSAIFQCLEGEKKSEVHKLILTASGGPFRKKEKHELQKVTVSEALNHPNWSMGNKITIDSATMMNKGLEVIEAKWLFNLPKEKIDVIIHPQSVIHSMVEFIDGSIKAQISLPDMKLPIQYALSYPERFCSKYVETNFPEIHQISFYEPDIDKFECLKLAYDVMESGGITPCILNAANEIAVDKFLKGKIGFMQIPEIITTALNKFENIQSPCLETIFEFDRKTRDFVNSLY